MRNRKETMKLSVLSLAVQSALAAMFALPMLAQAVDATEADGVNPGRPTKFIEVGVGHVSDEPRH